MYSKNVGDEAYFLPAVKSVCFLQVDNITFDVRNQECSKYPK